MVSDKKQSEHIKSGCGEWFQSENDQQERKSSRPTLLFALNTPKRYSIDSKIKRTGGVPSVPWTLKLVREKRGHGTVDRNSFLQNSSNKNWRKYDNFSDNAKYNDESACFEFKQKIH